MMSTVLQGSDLNSVQVRLTLTYKLKLTPLTHPQETCTSDIFLAQLFTLYTFFARNGK